MHPTVTLGELCEFENGDRGRNYPSKDAFAPHGVPFVNAGDLKDGNVSTVDCKFITDQAYEKIGGGKFSDGDILFCLRGSLGKVGIVKGPRTGAIASSLVILRNKPALHVNYLHAFLQSDACQNQVKKVANGAAQPNLSATNLKEFIVPLPPLEEQMRIARILDQADALRRLRRQALDKLNTLGQAIFHEMFGDPATNPNGWEKRAIGDLRIKVADGNYAEKYPRASDFVPTGVPFVRANNIRNGTVNTQKLRYITSEKHALLKKGHLRHRDVLVSTRGQIGQIAIVPPELDGANINAQLVLLRADETELDAQFLATLLSTPSMRRAMERLQTGVALKQLPVKRLKSIEIVVPNLETQQGFGKVFHEISSVSEQYALGYQAADMLFSSLQQRAFCGEL